MTVSTKTFDKQNRRKTTFVTSTQLLQTSSYQHLNNRSISTHRRRQHSLPTPSHRLRYHVSLCTPLHSLTSNTEIPRDPKECARNFITQRAVQQTIFHSFMLRDETNARWLEAFLNHTGLYDLHACNALRLPGNDYLMRLFRAPPETLQIHKPIQGRTNNKNPYIKRRYFTYEVDIIPRKIASRILQVRAQIADELIYDLRCIPADNERLISQYRRLTLTKSTGANTDLPPSGDQGGSPYRVATFDLAKNYTLYYSLLVTSRRLQNKPTGDSKWLKQLCERYVNVLLAPPGGEQGVSDRVVREVFSEIPSINVDGKLFDPLSLGERVLEERTHCSNEWVEYLTGVRNEHLELEKLILETDI